MPGKYIPNPDAEFEAWFARFLEYCVANAAALGLTPADILEIQAGKATWGVAYANDQTKHLEAKAATQTKNEKREAAETTIRKHVKMIQARPGTTDAQRAGLGITVPDRERTPTDPEAVKRLRPPSVFGDFGTEREVDLHFGVNPRDERANAKPKEAAGARIWRYEGTIPAGATPVEIDALPWVHVADHPHSPWLDPVGRAGTFTYRAQWYDHLGNLGPLGDPVTCAVTG